MRHRLILVAALSLILLGAASTTRAQESPSAALDRGSATPGDTVLVTGRSWPDATVVQAQLCGNEARNGSIDCDRAAALTIGVGADGRFGVMLPITMPPAPCPCVVLVTSPDLISASLRLPIEVAGAPTAEPVHDLSSVPIFAITDLHISGGGSLRSFFGLDEERSLVMTVENLGPVAIDSLPVTLAESTRPDRVIASGVLESLAPGESAEVRIEFRVPALSRGSTTINATVDQSGQAIASSASFTTFPWGLVASVAAILLLAALMWRRTTKRRPLPRHAIPAASADGSDGRSRGLGTADPEPYLSSLITREEVLADELAERIEGALADVGPLPGDFDPDQLAQRMAERIVAELCAQQDLTTNEATVLTTSIRDELASELRQLLGTAAG